MSLSITQCRARLVRRMLKKLCPDAGMILLYSNPWELLVAVVLSAQCTDKKVNEVTRTLFVKYPTFDAYLVADLETFGKDIFQTGFYRAKARHILSAAQLVHEQFKGVVPKTMAELLTIPGVGRKTANVILGNAFGMNVGIAVDTHVGRLSRKFGLSTHHDPKKIEQDLLRLIPQHEWFTFTYDMIEYGRRFSPARLKAPTDPISVALKKKGLL